ncbi:class I SAM-dependent methyltransferase [Sporomusa sp.]|uniref:class I SAM-dependent methyltransferase n=1 Tax=Sporomusa sp. TaxID=2078658 RepID=UPI002C3020C1|nr:class I SAM-dependent methyltransferase [Sporomusa sp.]HWR42637.1 class I SAM-dependent methyltransferase [Sporomusa sp.]
MTIEGADFVQYYNHTAAEYAEKYLHELDNKPLDRYSLQVFANLVKDNGPVCDVGCGSGHIAGHLVKYGVNIFGIDLSAGMVNEARRCFPAIDFQVANMFALPVSDNHLAGISAFYAIVHSEPAQIPLLVKEFHRSLKPGGFVLLSFHIGPQEVIRVNKQAGAEEVFTDYVFHNYEHIIGCLEENGFELAESFIRHPYRDVEYPSRRAYVRARIK